MVSLVILQLPFDSDSHQGLLSLVLAYNCVFEGTDDTVFRAIYVELGFFKVHGAHRGASVDRKLVGTTLHSDFEGSFGPAAAVLLRFIAFLDMED